MAEPQDSLPGRKIRQTRERLDRMRRLARDDDDHDGIELFGALCDYLDELCGQAWDEQPPPAGRRERATTMISAIMAAPADPPIRRLTQPVNASVTLARGRELAIRLVGADDWRAELGAALIELYRFLDTLHGGSFTQLLNSAERRQVAAVLAEADQ